MTFEFDEETEMGAILELSNAGGADNTVKTIMEWEGTLTGLPTLSDASVSAGWEIVMPMVGNTLQVVNDTLPDPSNMLGDFDENGVVDCADLDGYIGNLGSDGADGVEATGALEALDFDLNGFLSLADAISVTQTLIVTQPNGVTGTFRGDVNCDGQVDILNDAFILIQNLNGPATSYSQGDLNFDGTVSVLGDAFVFIANLNQSNDP